ncbi:Apo-citrate lyase phosphoribosyl-dephospho-CoA transferase [Commensalibacter sp. Nvir]|uniref:citrate lyase holo-[acyl-carrier protein] synthase n=1 Tax=Commensalibacter sp. Nvir TaxID=3069817 RepID=UPI002D5ED687|nr:Apo-citrate lyase phosphoribosyl-dephospho-CoA transferase [Commensalibacter sp. Nvir]
MTKDPDIFHSILQARENRARKQQDLLEKFKLPLISITIVSPGEKKSTPLILEVFAEAIKSIRKTFMSLPYRIVAEETNLDTAGPESFFVIEGTYAERLKNVTIHLEDTHPLGRLWDLDVITPSKNIISRKDLGFSERRCLVCSEAAKNCARSQAHSLLILEKSIRNIFLSFRKGELT